MSTGDLIHFKLLEKGFVFWGHLPDLVVLRYNLGILSPRFVAEVFGSLVTKLQSHNHFLGATPS